MKYAIELSMMLKLNKMGCFNDVYEEKCQYIHHLLCIILNQPSKTPALCAMAFLKSFNV